jgi:hypothetical protein
MYKIAKEVAEVDFIRMCDANRVEHDTTELTEDERKDWTELHKEFLRDLREGTLIVGEDGTPTYTPPGATKGITFHPPTGATYMALETYAGKKDIANFYAAMADMTRVDRGEFGKMALRDVQACMRVAKLFLAPR